MRETNLAMLLRPNDALVLYDAACTFCSIQRKAEAMDAISKAWRAGFRHSDWTRRDPDLSLLHVEVEFEKLFSEKPAANGSLDRRFEPSRADPSRNWPTIELDTSKNQLLTRRAFARAVDF